MKKKRKRKNLNKIKALLGNNLEVLLIENSEVATMSIYGKLVQEEYAIEISADSIKELCKCFSNQSIEESVVLTESINFAPLNKLGLSKVIPQIQSKSNTLAKDVANIIKEKGITKESKQTIATKFDQFYTDIANFITENIDQNIVLNIFGKEYNTDRIIDALTIFLFMFVTSIVMNIIFTIIFTPQLGTILFATIGGPIVEEGSKQLAIRKGCTAEYTILFNTFEISKYVSVMSMMGIPINKSLPARLIVAGMHVTTTIIQYLTTNEKIKKKLGLDKEEDKEKLSLIGHITGFIIHASWNCLGVFSKKFTQMILRI